MRRISRIDVTQGESNARGNLPQNQAKYPQLMSRSASAPPPALYSSPVMAWRTSVIGPAYGSQSAQGRRPVRPTLPGRHRETGPETYAGHHGQTSRDVFDRLYSRSHRLNVRSIGTPA